MRRLAAAMLAVMLTACGLPAERRQAGAERDMAAGRYAGALAAYGALERGNPGDGRVLHQTGVAHYRLEDDGAAATAFRGASLALREPRDRARALHNLGNALARSGRLEEALGSYREALRLADREDTRLNYELVRARVPRSEAAEVPQRPLDLARDQRLFDSARAIDITEDREAPPDRPSRRVREW